jgi:hypothetical protein
MLPEDRYMHQQVFAHVVALPLLRWRGHNSDSRPSPRQVDLSRLVRCQNSHTHTHTHTHTYTHTNTMDGAIKVGDAKARVMSTCDPYTKARGSKPQASPPLPPCLNLGAPAPLLLTPPPSACLPACVGVFVFVFVNIGFLVHERMYIQ